MGPPCRSSVNSCRGTRRPLIATLPPSPARLSRDIRSWRPTSLPGQCRICSMCSCRLWHRERGNGSCVTAWRRSHTPLTRLRHGDPDDGQHEVEHERREVAVPEPSDHEEGISPQTNQPSQAGHSPVRMPGPSNDSPAKVSQTYATKGHPGSRPSAKSRGRTARRHTDHDQADAQHQQRTRRREPGSVPRVAVGGECADAQRSDQRTQGIEGLPESAAPPQPLRQHPKLLRAVGLGEDPWHGNGGADEEQRRPGDHQDTRCTGRHPSMIELDRRPEGLGCAVRFHLSASASARRLA